MEWVETTGRSLEEAKDAALDQLGVDETEAEFEILEEPRTGLFGRVRGEARIRARVRPARPRPKVERRDRSRKRSERKPAGGKDARSGGGKPAAKAASGAKAKAKTDDDASATETGGAGGRGGTERSGGRDGGGAAKRAPKARPARDAGRASEPQERDGTEAPSERGDDMTDDDVTVEEQAELTTEFLTGLLDAFGVQGTIEQERVDDDTIELGVVGQDLGLLIGPKGQTLVAIQELSRTHLQRRATGHHQGRVRIDVGGYRQRRREALERFTIQVAEQVRESGVQRALEPMGASDRKVVHDVANGLDGIRTISEGEEPRRRVVIAPE